MECFALNRVITFSQEGGLLPLITLVRGRRLELHQLQLKEEAKLNFVSYASASLSGLRYSDWLLAISIA